MSAGTKIFLACGVLIVGTLVVYYTMIMGGDSELLVEGSEEVAGERAATDGATAGGTDERAGAPGSGRSTPSPASATPRSGRATPSVNDGTSPRTRTPSVTMGEPTNPANVTPVPRGTTPAPVSGTPEPRLGGTGASGRVANGGKNLADEENPALRQGTVTPNRPSGVGDPLNGRARTVPPPRNNGAPRTNTGDRVTAPPRSNTSCPTPRVSEPRTVPTPVDTNAQRDYFVRPGDTLSSIAHDYFGDESKWELIAKANPGIVPDRIRPGDLLRLPPKSRANARSLPTPSAPKPSGNTYTVKSGDTLSDISKAVWGRASLWQQLYEANRDIIGDDHHKLKIGMVLRVPAKPAA